MEFSVYLFDTEGNWHYIGLPAPMTDDRFQQLKEQVCALLGVADTRMFWEGQPRSAPPRLRLSTNANTTSDAPVHEGFNCDGCDASDFAGRRYKCLRCFDLDLCHECYTADHFEQTGQVHTREHAMQCIDIVDGSTHISTVVACVFCDAKGLSTAECYDHVKKYHKKEINGAKDNNEDSAFKKMLAELWDELKQRKEDLEEKEKDFEERKRAIDEKERIVRAREDAVKKTETALKSKESDLKDREAVNKCREEAASVRENALAAREALAEKREEAALSPSKWNHETKKRKQSDGEDEKNKDEQEIEAEETKNGEDDDVTERDKMYYALLEGTDVETYVEICFATSFLHNYGMSPKEEQQCVAVIKGRNEDFCRDNVKRLVSDIEFVMERTGLTRSEALQALLPGKCEVGNEGRAREQNTTNPNKYSAVDVGGDLMEDKKDDGDGIVEVVDIVFDPSGPVVIFAEEDVGQLMHMTQCDFDRAVRALAKFDGNFWEAAKHIAQEQEDRTAEARKAMEEMVIVDNVVDPNEADYDSDSSYENIDFDHSITPTGPNDPERAMTSSITVGFMDSEENWHLVDFPAPFNGEHFDQLQEQVNAQHGTTNTKMIWEDDQGSMRAIDSSKSLEEAMQHSLILAEKGCHDPWLAIYTEHNPPPSLLHSRINFCNEAMTMDEPPTLRHNRVGCDGCGSFQFTGLRYKCMRCLDFDLCQECYTAGDRLEKDDQVHSREHPMKCIDIVYDDSSAAYSSRSFTILACVYCDATGFSTAECYEHVKKYHKKQLNEKKENETDSSFKKMLAELWDELKQRKKDLEDKEKNFEKRKTAFDEKEREIMAREDTVKRTETALKTKVSDLEDREAVINGREEALLAREALAEKREEIVQPLKQEMKYENVASMDSADVGEVVTEKETDKENEKKELDRQVAGEDSKIDEDMREVENIYEMHEDHVRLRLFFYRCALGVGKDRQEDEIIDLAFKNLESWGMSETDIKLCIILLVNKASTGGFGQPTEVELISKKTGLSHNEAICAYIGTKCKMAELGRFIQQNSTCCLVDDFVQKKDKKEEDGTIVESSKDDSPIVDDPSDGIVNLGLNPAEKENVGGIIEELHDERGMAEAAAMDDNVDEVVQQEETDYDSDSSYENIDLEFESGN